MVEGPFDQTTSPRADHRRTGQVQGRTGSMELKALSDGTGYDFIFHVLA